jgi:hypothetical protein
VKRRSVHDLQVDVNNVVAGLFDLRLDPAFARAAQLADELAAEVEIATRKRSR